MHKFVGVLGSYVAISPSPLHLLYLALLSNKSWTVTIYIYSIYINIFYFSREYILLHWHFSHWIDRSLTHAFCFLPFLAMFGNES